MVRPKTIGIRQTKLLYEYATKNNPLHGITLQQIVDKLVEHYGRGELGQRIDIKCFNKDPSVKSSLKFLRKTPWAREKVESLYISTQQDKN